MESFIANFVELFRSFRKCLGLKGRLDSRGYFQLNFETFLKLPIS